MAEIPREIPKMLLRIPTYNQYQEILAGEVKSVHMDATQRWVISPYMAADESSQPAISHLHNQPSRYQQHLTKQFLLAS